MISAIFVWSLTLAEIILAAAMVCSSYRVVSGPRAQDRVVGLDSLYINGMLLKLVFGSHSGRTLYFEAALIIAILGFVGTVAVAKFRMRGEVIE